MGILNTLLRALTWWDGGRGSMGSNGVDGGGGGRGIGLEAWCGNVYGM